MALGLALLFSGCSVLQDLGESEPEGANEAPTTTRPGTEQDAQLASGALLALTDFGEGWSEVPADSSDPFEELYDERDRRLSECTGNAAANGLMAANIGEAKAETGTFTAPDTDSTVEHSVGLSPDVASATAGMTALENPSLPACLQDTFRWFVEKVVDDPPDPSDTLPPGATVGDVSVARLNVAPAGDQTVALRIAMPIQIGALTVTQYFDLVFVRSGRALSQLQFGSVFEPSNMDVVNWMSAVAANKLATIGAQ